MNKFPRKIITGLLLASALVGGQAQAEMQTINNPAVSYVAVTPAIKNFTNATPCYIYGSKDHPNRYSKIIKIFKDKGFNITDDESADCQIAIFGEVVYDKASGGKSVSLNDILSNQGKLNDVEPDPKFASEATNGANKASINSGDPIGANGMGLLTQAGGAVNGFHGIVGGEAAGLLINLFSGIHPEHTPPGAAKIVVGFQLGSFFHRGKITHQNYTASTTPEKPEDLIYAGTKQMADTIVSDLRAYHVGNPLPFDQPLSSEQNST
jgi:hypothetical protein